MGYNGNSLDGLNEQFTNDSLGQTSVRTVTEVRNSDGIPVDPATSDKQDLIAVIQSLLQSSYLVSDPYDNIALTYSNGLISTIVYKLTDTTVNTITFTYTNGLLTAIQKS